ncbi:putative AMP-binding enzyme C-terminal domain [Lyophyllum shimeji]|uniref:AMP-binding enzyme C-terminal domain n=1 Tax=Lyophyllum shimeji TaxID=47721 RepID=A0A9P3ULX1_LYOSH|nr:putative AMP-binding enzyme C-terminal domain [Lyophyllum shimeji]
MAPRLYTSPVPSQPIPASSIFTHLFASPPHDPNTIGGFPASTPAFVDAESRTVLTRAQTKHFALCLAYGLKHHLDVNAKRGDVVLVFSQNSLSWPVALFGSVAAGLRCTLANSAYTPKELAFQYSDSGARLLFTSEEGLATVLAMFKLLGVDAAEARRRIVVLEAALEWAGGPSMPRTALGRGLKTLADLLSLGKVQEEERFDGRDTHETVYLCYSSGTTGKPKGVETTHQNVIAVLEIVKTTFPKLSVGTDSVLGILPFYHIYGAVKLVHFPWTSGTPVVIQPRFDPEKFCAAIERYKITHALIVPPVLVVMARHPAVDKYDISSLKSLFSGAAPLGAALVKQVTERVQRRKGGKGEFTILQGYGLTETSPTTHLLPVPDAIRKVGSIGVLLPNLQARLLVDGDGNGDVEAKEGEPGELWIRGPTIMKGYLNNPAATKDSITPDGWFKTGDIAVRDNEGYYYIVDRRKELIKYKGFQVPPAELESLLLTHPDIADVAVIGVYSAKEATELPRAYVVHAHPEQVKTEAAKAAFQQAVRKWTKERVARHKQLRGGVVVIDVIPKSAAGKILRRELRERAKTELAGRDPGDADVKAKL